MLAMPIRSYVKRPDPFQAIQACPHNKTEILEFVGKSGHWIEECEEIVGGVRTIWFRRDRSGNQCELCGEIQLNDFAVIVRVQSGLWHVATHGDWICAMGTARISPDTVRGRFYVRSGFRDDFKRMHELA